MMRVLNYLISSFALGITFLYGSTGEILTEKSGHLNLGIPGIMCVGAAGGCAAIQMLYGSDLPGFLVVLIALIASFLSAALMGAFYCFLAVTLHANQNVTGLAMTTFGVGLTKYVMFRLEGYKYLYAVSYFRFPFQGQNSSLLYCGVMVYLGIAIALVASYVLTRTRVGLHLRAVGENPATADAAGINVTAYKYGATCIGSGIAGLGGLFYIMDYAGTQESYLTIEALGWLAVALVIFALWKPHISIVGSAAFGILFAAGSFISGLGIGRMSTTPLMKILPYAVTVIVLIITSIRNKPENQPPAGLGINYFREER